jgi:hypothetical protein
MAALTIALSKGRNLDETLPLMRAAGIVPAEDPDASRKLILDTSVPAYRSYSCGRPMCRRTCSTAPPISASWARTS